MYSLKKNFERAKVVIIVELYKFLLGICGVFFVRGAFVRVLWGFLGHFSCAMDSTRVLAPISARKLPQRDSARKNHKIRAPQENLPIPKLLSNKQIPHTMKKKILPILIAIFWIAFFSYLTYLGLYAVVILSLILLMMSMAMSVSNEAES